MHVKNIQLKNFRNYPDLNLDITSQMVVLSGPNAVGKTNLLESVYFGSVFKSFRDDAEFIFLKGASQAEIRLQCEKNSEDVVLEIYLENREKIYANFRINGVKRKRKDAQNFLRVVIFEPSDVDMFGKQPEVRRKYLNMVLSQKDIGYLDDSASFKKVLAQKNKLLLDAKAGKGSAEALPAWNKQLIELGSRIILDRKGYIQFLNQNIAEVYTSISGFHRPVEVEYETIAGDTLEEIQENFSAQVDKMGDKERLLGTSLVGPHRDDFYLKSEGLYLSPFSSRGELRSQVLALKILELEYLTVGGDTPILLLDDVLSELDENRRTYLLKFLQGKFQTFITTTHPLEMAAQHVTLTPSIAEEVE